MGIKTSVIIPTYNRPQDLTNCMQSILSQSVKPDEIIVVDDGDLPGFPLLNECKGAGIRCLFHKKNIPGLTASRNIGVRLSTGKIIFFLDDDVKLFPDYIEKILNVYELDKENIIGGVGGFIANHKPLKLVHRLFRLYEIVFLLAGLREGRVLISGYSTDFGTTGNSPRHISKVDFLSGGASSFRKKVFRETSFSEEYRGYGRSEDKDFSYQVSRKYRLVINPDAKLFHYAAPKIGYNKWKLSRDIIFGKYRFFKNNIKKGWWSWIFFYYALSGYILKRIIMMIFSFDMSEVYRVKGILSALRDVLSGKID